MNGTLLQRYREVPAGERFDFGKNWKRFLSVLNEARIAMAERSLQQMLEVHRLDGTTFLDVGSGSGLLSLAAAQLGAKVHSFDHDPESVACTQYLKQQCAPRAQWTVEEGSVLDTDYLGNLGEFDVVYSWGVLHHTGALWQALENVVPLVRPGGKLFIAIYNDQGAISHRWRTIKRLYNKGPRLAKPVVLLAVLVVREGRLMLGHLLHGRNPLTDWSHGATTRGMSRWYDWVDWIGGYPFEVARSEDVFDFYRTRGLCLTKMRTQGGSLGCNEFVFLRDALCASRRAKGLV